MKTLIEKPQQKNKRRRRVQFNPEAQAYIQSQLNFVPGMNITSNTSVQQINQQARQNEKVEREIPKTRAEGSYRNVERRRKSGKTKDQEDTERDIKLATQPTWRSDVADALHYAGTGLSTVGGGLALLSNPITTGTALVGGIVGGRAVDKASQNLTGKTWAENVQEKLGLQTPTLAEFTNPGYFIGGGLGLKGKGALNYLIKADMPRFGYTPTTKYYFKPGYLGINGGPIGKVPEGAKIVGEFKGEPLIEINGKKYLLSKYNELHGGALDLGYDPKVIAEEAKKDFTGPLARIIDNSEVLTSLADKIKRGEATTEFSRNKGTLVDPNARDVLAGELADIKRGKQKRGVALVNTMPTNITTTGQETYAGRGNFGLGSFSVTNHPGAVRAYGAIDYPKLIQHIKDSKMLTDNEKNSLYSYLKRMKELDKDPLSRMTENTDAKIKLNPEEDIEYQNLISQVNKLIPGTFEYGGLNRHILYQALKEPQIINVSSKSDKFGVSSRNVAREQLPLTDFQGHRLMTFNPKYNPNKSTSVEQVHGGYVGNILEAERLIGGYKYKNKFGNWEKEPGWNQTPSILQNLMGLLRGTNGKFYVRGVGPNGVPGAIDMVTLQAPNGGIPGFKLGNKLNYYKHV